MYSNKNFLCVKFWHWCVFIFLSSIFKNHTTPPVPKVMICLMLTWVYLNKISNFIMHICGPGFGKLCPVVFLLFLIRMKLGSIIGSEALSNLQSHWMTIQCFCCMPLSWSLEWWWGPVWRMCRMH
jgi:hypothetical protein